MTFAKTPAHTHLFIQALASAALLLFPAMASGQTSDADRITALETRLTALETTFRDSIVLTSQACATLGPGWAPLSEASGRFLLTSNARETGGDPTLSDRATSDTGGAETLLLEERHTPQHDHDISVDRHSHRVNMRTRNLILERGGGARGRPVSVRALESGGSEATDMDGAATGRTGQMPTPDPIDLMPPFYVVNACAFAGQE